jgi:hypothetical protein
LDVAIFANVIALHLVRARVHRRIGIITIRIILDIARRGSTGGDDVLWRAKAVTIGIPKEVFGIDIPVGKVGRSGRGGDREEPRCPLAVDVTDVHLRLPGIGCSSTDQYEEQRTPGQKDMLHSVCHRLLSRREGGRWQ